MLRTQSDHDARQDDTLERDAEALFREARRRERRRRVAGALVGLAIVAGIVIGVSEARGHGSPPLRAPTDAATGSAKSAITVRVKEPTSLAVSPTGTLYVIDVARDQILKRLPSGKFAVLAGSGRRGASGDGGPARRADLRLTNWSTLAVAKNGAVYFSDTGNSRVQVVWPSGQIETIAHQARMGKPRGLAIGPGDRLYIGGNGLLSVPLTGGTLHQVARYSGGIPQTHHQILEQNFALPYGDIAVDGAGDIYDTDQPYVYERTAAGTLRSYGEVRSGLGAAQLAEGPGGVVYGADIRGIFRFGASGRRYVVRNRRIDLALGWRELTKGSAVIAPEDGFTVAPDGTVYFDTDSGDGWEPGAIAEITPSGRVLALWRASGRPR